MTHSSTKASSTPSSCTTTSPSNTSAASATATVPHTHSRMTDNQMNINIERNHRTFPPQFQSSSPSIYPISGGENRPTNKIASNSPLSSSIPPGTRPHRKGPTKYPKIELDRLDTEKAAVITSLSGKSDVSLAPSLSATITTGATVTDILDQGTQEQSEQQKTRQSSKAGMLSNLLKLQGIARLEKQHRRPKVKATKQKIKRPTMYSHSANPSTASLITKSVFGTYLTLPDTRSQQQQGSEEKMQIKIALADILERKDFILRLAKSLIKYGAPSHRLEDAVDHAAKTLEISLQCIYLPNMMIVSFIDYETHTSETYLLKVAAGLDMYKCALVHQVQKMVTHSSMPVEEAIMKLDTINTEKDANGRWITVLAYAVAGFCTAPMFFKANWIDAIISFFMGAAVGLSVWLSEEVLSYAHICDITMSALVAFVAEALRQHNVCTSAIKFAGIVMILPGFTITCSILELSSRHIISGSVRLFYAVVFSLLLGYGLTIGASLWSLFDHSTRNDKSKFSAECPNAPLNPLWNILFVPFFAISLNIWLKAHPRQWLLATILSIVGYGVSYTSSVYGGVKTEVSSAVAAFAIGLCGNIYQRLTSQLTFQAVVCAVFFLVPGSIGLKGAMAWFTEDMSGGMNFALQMVVTAIAISVRLFTSALVIYPMGKTRSAQMTF
ncbi:hypothetical protein BGX24_009209 [Mortierella sp. AD032]|nr:hypothetical protein BGX24_009209 [Mortierella sp. AD032]